MHTTLFGEINILIDDIGEKLFDFMIDNNLTMLNKTTHGPTFLTQHGSSYVDLTLCSHQLNRICVNWECSSSQYLIGSDHVPITCQIAVNNYNERLTSKDNFHYVWKFEQEKWEQFQELLDHNLQEWLNATPDFFPNDVQQLEHAVDDWTQCMVKTANQIFGKKKVFKGSKPW